METGSGIVRSLHPTCRTSRSALGCTPTRRRRTAREGTGGRRTASACRWPGLTSPMFRFGTSPTRRHHPSDPVPCAIRRFGQANPDVTLWLMELDGVQRLSREAGVHSGVRRSGVLVRVARCAGHPGGQVTALRARRPPVDVRSLVDRPVLDVHALAGSRSTWTACRAVPAVLAPAG